MKYVSILSLMMAFAAYSTDASAQQDMQLPKVINIDLGQFGLPGKKLIITNPTACDNKACDDGIEAAAKRLEPQFKACATNPTACNNIKMIVPACGKCTVIIK